MKFRNIVWIIFISLIWNLQAMAQVTLVPKVEKQRLAHINISRVELKGEYTIIDFTYVSPFEGTGTICADPGFYIQAAGKPEKKYVMRIESIPRCPLQYNLKQKGEVVKFRLYFPHIGHSVYKIDVVEGPGERSFNFYGVSINNTTPKKPNTTAGSTNKNKSGSATPGNSTTTTPANTKPELVFNNKKIAPKDSVPLNILFEHARDELEPQSLPELDKLADFMKKYPTVTIQLEGHTERDETHYDAEQRASNKKLSEQRVANVRYYLVKKGISPSRVLTKAYGGTRPVSKDQTLNRRVVMKILKYE